MCLHSYRDESHSRHFDLIGGGGQTQREILILNSAGLADDIGNVRPAPTSPTYKSSIKPPRLTINLAEGCRWYVYFCKPDGREA